MADHNTNLSRFLAAKIFDAGTEGSDKVQRIAFRGGHYPDEETDLGGFCEDALAKHLKRALDEWKQR